MKQFAAMVFALAASASADGAWLRLNTSHFEILTDASEQTGRKLAARLEDVHAVFQQEVGPKSAPLPIRVFLLRTEKDFELVRPSPGARGFYQSGADRDYIVLSAAGDLERTPVHEFVHLARGHSSPPAPRWLEEGLAEYYSTFAAGGGERDPTLIWGRAVESHLGILRTLGWRTAEEVASRSRSILHDGKESDAVFYSQSWLLVYMLRHSPKYRDGFGKLLKGLEDGLSTDAAFRAAYATGFSDAMRDAREFLEAGRFAVVTSKWTPPARLAVRVETLGGEAAELVQADMFLRSGRPAESEKQIRKIKVSKATDAATLTQLALYLLSTGKEKEAADYLQRATGMADAPAAAFFEYAMLLRDRRAGDAMVEELLRKVVSLAPSHGEAQFLLGELAFQRREFAAAIGHYERAVAVFPRRFSFWYALALASRDSGDSQKAREAALRALESAALPHEREMAEVLVETR